MIDSSGELTRPRFAVDATPATRLAWLRAWTVLERTMLSWVITSITFIGFGFTIVLVFDEFSRFTGVAPPLRPPGPAYFGLSLIGTGVAALIVGGWRYRTVLRYLRLGDFTSVAAAGRKPAQTLVYAITIVTIFIGVFAFLAVAARAL